MHLACQSSQIRQRSPKVRKLVDLTRKFFAIACNHEEPFEFTIKEVCDKLAIESRRLYDLINVLEALGIIIKRQGPHYEFIGLAFVDQAVQTFVSQAASSNSSSLNANSRFKLHELSIWFMSHIIKAAPGSVSLASIENTLGLKSSQVRRLYDITNILEGMHLITIINQRGSKPSYSWNNERLSTVCRSIITKVDQMGLDVPPSGKLAKDGSVSKSGHSLLEIDPNCYPPRKRKRTLHRNSSDDCSSTTSSSESCSESNESSMHSCESAEIVLASPVAGALCAAQQVSQSPISNSISPREGLGAMQIVNLSSPSKAVLVSDHAYWGISHDTPQTRRFVSTLLKLSQEKEQKHIPAAGPLSTTHTASITPCGTAMPLRKGFMDQTPHLQKLYADAREGSVSTELTPLENVLDPCALEAHANGIH